MQAYHVFKSIILGALIVILPELCPEDPLLEVAWQWVMWFVYVLYQVS